MVQVDGAGSGGLVDPGVACWVGISGALGAREDKGLVGMAVRVMNLSQARSSIESSIEPFGTLSIRF